MLYLLLAIFSTAMVSIIMRLSERKTNSDIGLLAVNYVMCTLMSLVFAGEMPVGPLLHITAAMGAVNGIFYLAGFLLLQWSVKKNGVVLSSTFMKLGLLVGMAVSVLFFHEVPTPVQVVGFLLAVTAIVLINFRKEEAAGGAKGGLVWLLLCGGMADAMSKIFEELGPAGFGGPFLFFTFLTALGLCTAVMLLRGGKPGKWEVLFGLLIGIPNFLSTRLLLRSLADIPAVIAYPVYSVGGILLVTLVGVLAFRERLRRLQWAGMGLILVALVLLNI